LVRRGKKKKKFSQKLTNHNGGGGPERKEKRFSPPRAAKATASLFGERGKKARPPYQNGPRGVRPGYLRYLGEKKGGGEAFGKRFSLIEEEEKRALLSTRGRREEWLPDGFFRPGFVIARRREKKKAGRQ